MAHTIDTGNATFNFDVPYKLLATSDEEPKPLIVYLHGYRQNLEYFEKKCQDLLSLKAYHLFIQGPYPIYDEKQRREVAKWGRAWYLYDGNQDQFISSMEKSSNFIESVVEQVKAKANYNRVSLLGYSMGGYLAGYFALSRPQIIQDLLVIGGRIKSELFADRSYPSLNVLALHGAADKSVSSRRAQQSCKELRKTGARVTYKKLDGGHKLKHLYLDTAKEWLTNNGYKDLI